MTYIAKPKFQHPGLPKNDLGYTHRDYEGKISTLCAGCGHDSITASIIEACYELSIEPHRVAKISGIGCSSKTPDYFLGNSHGFNSVHGRMPSVLTGANLANRDLIYLGVSGDGDSRLDRLRPVRAFDPARRQHDLYRREQRRVRPDQGPVLGHRRPRLEVQEGRDEHRQRHRPGGDRAAARRELRGAQLLRRQDATGAADRGRDQRHELRLVAGEGARHETRAELQRDRHEVDGVVGIDHAALRLRAAVGGGENWPLVRPYTPLFSTM